MNKTLLTIFIIATLGFVAGLGFGFTQRPIVPEQSIPVTPIYPYEDNTPVPHKLLRSYQLQIVDDTRCDMYDGIRYVGSIRLNTNPRRFTQLDHLIIGDNE